MSKNNLYLTKDAGYDVNVGRYYVILLMLKDRKEYKIMVQCKEYHVNKMEAEDLTIEFLDDKLHSTKQLPYEKGLFQEIELMGCTTFEEMKDEEMTSGAI